MVTERAQKDARRAIAPPLSVAALVLHSGGPLRTRATVVSRAVLPCPGCDASQGPLCSRRAAGPRGHAPPQWTWWCGGERVSSWGPMARTGAEGVEGGGGGDGYDARQEADRPDTLTPRLRRIWGGDRASCLVLCDGALSHVDRNPRPSGVRRRLQPLQPPAFGGALASPS